MKRNIKQEFVLWGLIMASFVIIAPIIGYFSINGTFHTSTEKYTVEQVVNKYPTPKSLDDALIKGEIQYNDLPKELQALMDYYHTKGNK